MVNIVLIFLYVYLLFLFVILIVSYFIIIILIIDIYLIDKIRLVIRVLLYDRKLRLFFSYLCYFLLFTLFFKYYHRLLKMVVLRYGYLNFYGNCCQLHLLYFTNLQLNNHLHYL